MSRKLLTVSLVLLHALLPGALAEQPGFSIAKPGWEFAFPRDHGSHDSFQTEWWYFTGQLSDTSGGRYGYELTFFRVGITPPLGARQTAWDLENLALTHFALTDIGRGEFRYYEKVNRMSPFTAGAAAGRMELFNEGWSATTLPDGSWRIRAAAEGDAVELTLRALKRPAIHGSNGVSVKGRKEGNASHYYSMTRLEATGRLAVRGEWRSVRGLSWMDHEFSTSVLEETQSGWDWFSLQFDDGTELMLYQIRTRDGKPDVTSSGSFVDRRGVVTTLASDDFAIRPTGSWTSPESGATYPMGWEIDVPALSMRLRVDEELEAQELITEASTDITYWEGAVAVSGTAAGRALRGAGYVELTGYAAPFTMPSGD